VNTARESTGGGADRGRPAEPGWPDRVIRAEVPMAPTVAVVDHADEPEQRGADPSVYLGSENPTLEAGGSGPLPPTQITRARAEALHCTGRPLHRAGRAGACLSRWNVQPIRPGIPPIPATGKVFREEDPAKGWRWFAIAANQFEPRP